MTEQTTNDSQQPSASTQGAAAEYQALTKHYVFNETGNILLCTTGGENEVLSEDFKSICAEVSVFFAAMTKAISSVENPLTGKPYSIYNYQALKRVIDNSGLFIGVNRTTKTVSSTQAGESFAQEMLRSLLGHDFGQTRVHFARGLFQSIGYETRKLTGAFKNLFDSKSKIKKPTVTKHAQTSGNIFFVCESLLGMPLISAVLIYTKPQNERPMDEIASISESTHTPQGINRSYTFSKDTYLFVAPKVFKNYSNELNTGDIAEYQAFVDKLSEALKQDA